MLIIPMAIALWKLLALLITHGNKSQEETYQVIHTPQEKKAKGDWGRERGRGEETSRRRLPIQGVGWRLLV